MARQGVYSLLPDSDALAGQSFQGFPHELIFGPTFSSIPTVLRACHFGHLSFYF
jgi:hypothetical protein